MYPTDFVENFWSRVNIKADKDADWIFDGPKDTNGYVKVKLPDGSTDNAHVIAYNIAKGELPDPKGKRQIVVAHTCNNRKCVNPHHLVAKTEEENTQQALDQGRRPQNR